MKAWLVTEDTFDPSTYSWSEMAVSAFVAESDAVQYVSEKGESFHYDEIELHLGENRKIVTVTKKRAEFSTNVLLDSPDDADYIEMGRFS